jgi:hypothetical protein
MGTYAVMLHNGSYPVWDVRDGMQQMERECSAYDSILDWTQHFNMQQM